MILGERTGLRAIEQEDLRTIWKWENDSAVMELASSSPERCISFETVRQIFGSSRPPDAREGRYLIVNADGEPLGLASYWLPNRRFDRSAEIGIYIGEQEHWHQGHGSEAFVLLMEVLFESLGMHRVGVSVGGHNRPMRRMMEKLGLTLEGTIREERLIHGAYHDTIKMGILRHEFESRHHRARRADRREEHLQEESVVGDI
jgi:RimJ/RimL family protein N-acetyltransferase